MMETGVEFWSKVRQAFAKYGGVSRQSDRGHDANKFLFLDAVGRRVVQANDLDGYDANGDLQRWMTQSYPNGGPTNEVVDRLCNEGMDEWAGWVWEAATNMEMG